MVKRFGVNKRRPNYWRRGCGDLRALLARRPKAPESKNVPVKRVMADLTAHKQFPELVVEENC